MKKISTLASARHNPLHKSLNFYPAEKYYKINTVKTAPVHIMTEIDAQHINQSEKSGVNVSQQIAIILNMV